MSHTHPHKRAVDFLGLPPAPVNTRERVLDTAIFLFSEKGFNAVGLDVILEKSEITKTTFYKYFESRDDLVIEAIQRRDAWEMIAWDQAVKKVAGHHPRDQLLGMFEVLDIWFNDPDYSGCLFINAASEFPNALDPAHQAAATHKRKCRDQFRDMARDAGATDPESFADEYTLLLEGTLVLRQVHDRRDAASVALAAVQRIIDHYMPEAR